MSLELEKVLMLYVAVKNYLVLENRVVKDNLGQIQAEFWLHLKHCAAMIELHLHHCLQGLYQNSPSQDLWRNISVTNRGYIHYN